MFKVFWQWILAFFYILMGVFQQVWAVNNFHENSELWRFRSQFAILISFLIWLIIVTVGIVGFIRKWKIKKELEMPIIITHILFYIFLLTIHAYSSMPTSEVSQLVLFSTISGYFVLFGFVKVLNILRSETL